MKYTRGEWRVPKDSKRSVEAKAFDGSWKYICDKISGGSPDEADANTHLIAASPDLLKALKSVVKVMYNTANEFEHMGGINKVSKKAKDAIAKAEGGLRWTS